MRLRFFIALLAIALLAGGCAATRAERQALGAAYSYLLMEGDTTRARERLEPLKDIYDKLFLMACAELTDGNLDKAKSYAERMVAMKPKVPDGKVLLGLVNRRIDHPDESWVVSFATAWKEEGKPEFSDLFSEWATYAENALYQAYRPAYDAVKGTPNELLMADMLGIINANTPTKTIELSLKYSEPDAPIEIRVFALSKLWSLIRYKSEYVERLEVPESLRPLADGRIDELLRQLSQEMPSVMIYDLLTLLESTSDKEFFNDEDISKLEKIADKINFSPSRVLLYDRYKKNLADSRTPLPQKIASNTYNSIMFHIFATFQLQDKIIATAKQMSGKDKLRLANICEKIGTALMKSKAYFEFLSRYRLINFAKELRGETNIVPHEEYLFFRTNITIALLAAVMESKSWPIQPLIIETIEQSIENQIGFWWLYTGKPMPEELKKYLE